MNFKLKVGDVVSVSKNFPPCMNHFKGRGKIAVVIERTKGYDGNYNSYGLHFKNLGKVWWYPENLLTLKINTTFQTLDQYIKEIL